MAQKKDTGTPYTQALKVKFQSKCRFFKVNASKTGEVIDKSKEEAKNIYDWSKKQVEL